MDRKNFNNLKKMYLWLFLLNFLLFSESCDHQNAAGIRFQEGDPCHSGRKTVKVAYHVKGRVSILDAAHPDTWAIVSQQGIIGQAEPINDGPDIVVPCNLPEKYKRQDLTVIFSGELKDSGDDFTRGNSVIYYSMLTAIKPFKTNIK